MQVATGLPVRIAAPSARNPGRMTHIVDHVKSALADGSLPSLATVPWDSVGTLRWLVVLGLGCCVDDPDDRIALSTVRTRLIVLLDRLSGRGGAAALPLPLLVSVGILAPGKWFRDWSTVCSAASGMNAA